MKQPFTHKPTEPLKPKKKAHEQHGEKVKPGQKKLVKRSK